jgi:hypothetical protein
MSYRGRTTGRYVLFLQPNKCNGCGFVQISYYHATGVRSETCERSEVLGAVGPKHPRSLPAPPLRVVKGACPGPLLGGGLRLLRGCRVCSGCGGAAFRSLHSCSPAASDRLPSPHLSPAHSSSFRQLRCLVETRAAGPRSTQCAQVAGLHSPVAPPPFVPCRAAPHPPSAYLENSSVRRDGFLLASLPSPARASVVAASAHCSSVPAA